MIRNLLMASGILLGLSGAAFANSYDPPLPPHAHSEAVSQGLPNLTGLDEGEARIHYSGRPQGNLSAGIPVVVGHQDGGPVIVYR